MPKGSTEGSDWWIGWGLRVNQMIINLYVSWLNTSYYSIIS